MYLKTQRLKKLKKSNFLDGDTYVLYNKENHFLQQSGLKDNHNRCFFVY